MVRRPEGKARPEVGLHHGEGLCRTAAFVFAALIALALLAPLRAATGDPAETVRFQSVASYAAAHPGAATLVEDFDAALGTSAPESGTGTPFPRGWYATFTAKAGTAGTVLEPTANTNTWCQNGDGVRNFAGQPLYVTKPTANANNQNTSSNRALGVATKNGSGEAYAGTGAAALGLNLKTAGYTVGELAFDFTSFSITNTKATIVGDPVPVGVMLNWSVQVANNPAGPWATLQTITHATQLGGATPGGVFNYHVDIPDLAAAVDGRWRRASRCTTSSRFISASSPPARRTAAARRGPIMRSITSRSVTR